MRCGEYCRSKFGGTSYFTVVCSNVVRCYGALVVTPIEDQRSNAKCPHMRLIQHILLWYRLFPCKRRTQLGI